MDSSYCWGETGDRIISLTTGPEAALIDMWCFGDKRSVAINTAHFLSALQDCSSPTDAKCKVITLSTLVKMTIMITRNSSFIHQCWNWTVMFLLLFTRTYRTEYCTVFYVWQQSHFYAANVWNQSMTKPITVLLNFIWCGNLIEWTHQTECQSDWQTINTTPCPQYFWTCDCWILEWAIEMRGHRSPGGISFAKVNHFFPLMSVEQTEWCLWSSTAVNMAK